MAPMVGKDITERLFLPRFCEMCCDCRMFHVRKVGSSDWPFHKYDCREEQS